MDITNAYKSRKSYIFLYDMKEMISVKH